MSEYFHQFDITRNAKTYAIRAMGPKYCLYSKEDGSTAWGMYLPLLVESPDWDSGEVWIPLTERYPNKGISHVFTREEYVAACQTVGSVTVTNAGQRLADIKHIIEAMVKARWEN